MLPVPLFLLVTSIVLMFELCALFAEPMEGKAQAKRLGENSRSRRNCRGVYSLLARAAALAAETLTFSPLLADPADTAVMQQEFNGFSDGVHIWEEHQMTCEEVSTS